MPKPKNRWLIVIAAVGIHISIGSVYAWSVFVKPIVAASGWSIQDVQATFSLAILFLGLSAAFLGRFVEVQGPRRAGALAALCFGLGLVVAGLAIRSGSLLLLYLGYGVLGGIGLGVGYITPVSTLVKWFPDRRGLATGLAIMGFGFASLLSGPLSQRLMEAVGLDGTFFLLGAGYLLLIFSSSRYLAPPPPGWLPQGYRHPPRPGQGQALKDESVQLTAAEAVRTGRFYSLWLMFFLNVTCGIAVISVASPLGQEIVGLTAAQAAAMVGLIGLFNGAGRIAWASLSDYLGRPNTYTAFFILQAGAFLWLGRTSDPLIFQGLLFLIMTCYGGGFACVPAFIGDLFGTRQLAAIHGYILTAWAAAGLGGPLFAAWVREKSGSYVGTLGVFIGLFGVALLLSILIRARGRRLEGRTARPGRAQKTTPSPAMERVFPAKIEVLGEVMAFVTGHADQKRLSERQVYGLQLAVEEAVLNICHHAYVEEEAVNRLNYAYRQPGRFTLRVRDEATALEVDIIDQGIAFNPLAVAPPDLNRSLEELELNRIGVFLMRQAADQIRYSRTEGRNVLTLIFNYPEAGL